MAAIPPVDPKSHLWLAIPPQTDLGGHLWLAIPLPVDLGIVYPRHLDCLLGPGWLLAVGGAGGVARPPQLAGVGIAGGEVGVCAQGPPGSSPAHAVQALPLQYPGPPGL